MGKSKWNYGLKDVVEDELVRMSKIKRFFKWLIFPAYFRHTMLTYIYLTQEEKYPDACVSYRSKHPLFSHIKSKVLRALLIGTGEPYGDKGTLIQEYRKNREDCLALWLGYKPQRECHDEDDSKIPEWMRHLEVWELSEKIRSGNITLRRASES